MILRLLVALVLIAPACTMLAAGDAAARKVQAGGAAAAESECRMTLRRSPALHGFRLGMTAAAAVKRFPEFPDLARFGKAKNSVDWKDASGALAISGSGGGDGDFGLSVLSFEGRYIKRRPPRGERTGEFLRLDLIFLDGRLVHIHVRDWVSPRWENVEGFKTWIERSYGLTGLAWRVTKQEKPPGITYFDFQGITYTIDCDGFSVAATCIGPPGPPNLCDLSFTDPSVPKIIEARRAAALKRGQKK